MTAKPLYSLLLASAALVGCSPGESTIEVDIRTAPNASGVVVLCGRETPLTERGHNLQAAVAVTCEGSGEARLRLENGDSVTCPIVYVTPEIDQHFPFVLEGMTCRERTSDKDS